MGKLVLLVLLAVAGILAYNWYTTGSVGFGFDRPTPEELKLDALQARFDAVRARLAEARRRGGKLSGQAADAMRELQDLARESEALAKDLQERASGTGADARSGSRRLQARFRRWVKRGQAEATRLRAAVEAFRQEMAKEPAGGS